MLKSFTSKQNTLKFETMNKFEIALEVLGENEMLSIVGGKVVTTTTTTTTTTTDSEGHTTTTTTTSTTTTVID